MPQEAFKIIEIELGFMYDLLHTKAKTAYTWWGLCRRLMTSTISCIVLAVFYWFVNRTPNYPRIDVAVTFVLLATNISSEIYWVFMLLASDWAEAIWFEKTEEESRCSKLWINNKSVVRNALLQLCKEPRWTNSAGQLNFFSLLRNFDARPSYCCRLLKRLHLHEKVGPYYYAQHQQIFDYIKYEIFRNIKDFEVQQLFTNSEQLHNELLKYWRIDAAPLSRNLELMDQEGMIMTWHIATELCYYYDDDEKSSSSPSEERKAAILLSRYMLYLYVTYPVMLQLQSVDANINFQRVRDVALEWFRDRGVAANLKKSDVEKLFEEAVRPKKRTGHAQTGDQLEVTRQHEVADTLFRNACNLARKLIGGYGENTSNSSMWTVLLMSWLANLIYAAYNCKKEYHTQQLRRGGELLTHVWMIMVHLGLTDRVNKGMKVPIQI